MSTAPAPQSKPAEVASPGYAWAGVALAALASAGGLYLFLVEGKIPCPLCYYQRAFAMGTLGVMLLGILGGFNQRFAVASLALPVAFAGLGIALWHVNLERTEVLECPEGALGISTAPKQSAVILGLLCAVLILDAYQPGRFGNSVGHVLGGAGVGLLIAFCCATANPPAPPALKEPYKDEKPLTCRRPYKAE